MNIIKTKNNSLSLKSNWLSIGRKIIFIRQCVFLSFCLIISLPAAANVEIASPFNNFVFGTWNGQGNISLSQSACIRSYTGNNIFNIRERDYAMRAQMNAPANSSSSPYVFYNVSNSNYSFPFSLETTDLLAGGSQTLNPDVFSTAMTYQIFICIFGGKNAELTVSALASDLYTVPAGNYRVSLDVEARRMNNGGGVTGDKDTQTNLQGTITIPPLVQLSNIDDIDFGIYDGFSSVINSNESFCVYSNVSNYTITPSTSTVGSQPTSYAMTNGSDFLEYTVRINNAANAATGAMLNNGQTSSALSTNLTYPLSQNCSGGDNAGLFIEVQGAALQSVTPGSYSGTLILQVAPI